LPSLNVSVKILIQSIKYQKILANMHIKHKIDTTIPNLKPHLAINGLSINFDIEANIIDQQKNMMPNIKKNPTNNFINPPKT